jgi:hypothetical protein
MSSHAGWLGTPSSAQDVPVLSHNIRTVFTFVRVRNDFASFNVSCVPRPITSMFLEFFRTNCSTPGASPAQALQCGAQNQISSGFFPVYAAARLTLFPERTSVTLIAGRGLFDFAAAAVAGAAVAKEPWTMIGERVKANTATEA